jgi:hypothetical protein
VVLLQAISRSKGTNGGGGDWEKSSGRTTAKRTNELFKKFLNNNIN